MRTHSRIHPATYQGRRRGRPVRLAGCALSAALLAMAACDDAAMTAPRDGRAGFAMHAFDLHDDEIDRSDTYLVADATTQTTTTVDYGEPTYDPATGRTVSSVTLPTIVESRRTEAGYGTDGTIRINEYYAGDTLSTVAHVRIVGDSVTYFDASGAPRVDLPGSELLATLGSFANDVVTDSMILPATASGDGTGSAPAPSYSVAGAAGATVRGDLLELRSDIGDPSLGARGEQRRTYRRRGDAWVLHEERRELRVERDGLATTTVELTRFRDVAWHNDPARDRARRERARRAGAQGASSAAPPPAFLATRPGRPGPAGALPALAPFSTTAAAFATPDEDTSSAGSTKPTGIALQHGAFSSADAWSRIAPTIALTGSVSPIVIETLDWRAELESQSRTLHGRIAASGGSRFLVIGHSNGGLVARRVAQMSAAGADGLVAGVVTIGAAHGGVPLARVGRTVVTNFLTLQMRNVAERIGGSCWRGQFAWVCTEATNAMSEFAPRIANFALDAAVPMVRDVQPGSTFLERLNATPEPFPRYSIVTASQGQWKFLRMLGDWLCDPGQSCSGNGLQNRMESVYEILRVCGSNTIIRARIGELSDKCRDARWMLSSLNAQYERWIAPGDDSDGLVPVRSQTYPGVEQSRQIVRRNAKESHVGLLKSTRVRQDLSSLVNTHLSN